MSTTGAGELRTVEIFKGGNQFQFRQYIPTGMADVHRRLTRLGFLQRLPASEFAREAGIIIGDINYIHPFREGNGRTQAQYLKQLAEQAGHALDLRRIDPKLWIDASKASHAADYSVMAEVIRKAIAPTSKR
jgi:cell filamentation protein